MEHFSMMEYPSGPGTRRRRKTFSLRPTTTYTVRLRLTTPSLTHSLTSSLTHSKLPQTLCLRTSPLLGHRLRRLLPAVVGGYVLKQQFHGSNFNTETQSFLGNILCDLCVLCGYSHLKTLNSQLPHSPKIFRDEFSFLETKRIRALFVREMQLSCTAAGSVGIILRVPLKREWYPGLKDCRVLEYDTEQQVYG